MWQNKEERENFWKLCGEHDRELLQKKMPMTIGDLDRLTYLSAYLGFEDYSLEIWTEFAPRFKTELLQIQDFQKNCPAWLKKEYTNSEKKIHALWLREFGKKAGEIPELLKR